MKTILITLVSVLSFTPQLFAQYSIDTSMSYVECTTRNTDTLGTDYLAYKIGKPFAESKDWSLEIWRVTDSGRRIQDTFSGITRTVDKRNIVRIDTNTGIVLRYVEKASGISLGLVHDNKIKTDLICRIY